jgi:transcription elongation factor GreA
MSPEYLTKEGLFKVQGQLNELVTTKRKELAERIRRAKELGDLSENAEYITAKDEQARAEGRILELRDLIRSAAIIGDEKRERGIVQPGSKVKIKVNLDRKEYSLREYTIVGSTEASPSEGRISNESPLGQALLGKKRGDSGLIRTPKGVVEFKIAKIT